MKCLSERIRRSHQEKRCEFLADLTALDDAELDEHDYEDGYWQALLWDIPKFRWVEAVQQ